MVINDNAELSKYLSKLAPLEARVNAMGRHGVFVCHYQAIASLVNLFSSYIPIAIATDIGPLNTPDTAYVNIEFCGKDTDKYLNRLEHSAEFMRNNQLSFAMTSGIMTFSHFVNFFVKDFTEDGIVVIGISPILKNLPNEEAIESQFARLNKYIELENNNIPFENTTTKKYSQIIFDVETRTLAHNERSIKLRYGTQEYWICVLLLNEGVYKLRLSDFINDYGCDCSSKSLYDAVKRINDKTRKNFNLDKKEKLIEECFDYGSYDSDEPDGGRYYCLNKKYHTNS